MKKQIFFVAALFTLTGCATDKIRGVVLPMDDDVFRVLNVDTNKEDVVKSATHDAKLTCQNKGKDSYKIITQDVKYTPKEYIDTGNKTLNALGIFFASSEFKKSEETYEVTTVFSCH